MTKTVEYMVIYERGENHWSGYVPDLPGCTTTGRTLEEAQTHIAEAIALWIEDAAECGEAIPTPTTTAAFAVAQIPVAA